MKYRNQTVATKFYLVGKLALESLLANSNLDRFPSNPADNAELGWSWSLANSNSDMSLSILFDILEFDNLDRCQWFLEIHREKSKIND